MCNILFKTVFMLYNVYHKLGKCLQLLKIDEGDYMYAILNRCYSSISRNKDLELSQAVSNSLCLWGLGCSKKPTQFQDGKPKEADHFGAGRRNTT